MRLHSPPRTLDERSLHTLIEESQDLHTDAMVVARATLPDLADHVADRRRGGAVIDPSQMLDSATDARSSLVRRLSLALGGVLGVGVVHSVFSGNASAEDGEIDVMIS